MPIDTPATAASEQIFRVQCRPRVMAWARFSGRARRPGAGGWFPNATWDRPTARCRAGGNAGANRRVTAAGTATRPARRNLTAPMPSQRGVASVCAGRHVSFPPAALRLRKSLGRRQRGARVGQQSSNGDKKDRHQSDVLGERHGSRTMIFRTEALLRPGAATLAARSPRPTRTGHMCPASGVG